MSTRRSRTHRGAGILPVKSPPFPMIPLILNPNAIYPQWGPLGIKRHFLGWKMLYELLEGGMHLPLHRGLLWLFIEDGLIDEDVSEMILEGGQASWIAVVQAMAENQQGDFHWSILDHLYQVGFFEEWFGKALYQS